MCAGVFAMAVCASTAFAQADAGSSPEPGDNPQVEKALVTPAAAPAVSDSAPVSAPTSPAVEPDTATAANKKRIEQRVDGTQEKAIKVAPRPKKNVSRIDNLPNKPKVVPKAVIKGPVSPWGYANRYAAGEIDRKSAKELQGKSDLPPSAQRGGAQAAPGASPGRREPRGAAARRGGD